MPKKIIVSRAFARSAGSRWYYTGKPCPRGHLVERYTKTGQCTQCMREENISRREWHREWALKTYHEKKTDPRYWATRLCRTTRRRARRLGVPFDLLPEDILSCLPCDMLCPVLKIPLVLGGPKNAAGAASLDRRLPVRGYVKGNISIVSSRANTLKRDVIDPAELRAIADYIERFRSL